MHRIRRLIGAVVAATLTATVTSLATGATDTASRATTGGGGHNQARSSPVEPPPASGAGPDTHAFATGAPLSSNDETRPQSSREAAQRRSFDDGTYIVQLTEPALAQYAGGVPGLRGTRSASGEPVRAYDADARAYRRHLAQARARVLQAVPRVEPMYAYEVTVNGFAARLTGAQASRLSRHRGVARVWKNETFRPQTTTSPRFLGLAGDDGVWQQRFGGPDRAGEGVIVGVIDGGFWPESRSLAPLPSPRPDADTIERKWQGDHAEGGSCWAGSAAKPEHRVSCNNKVIGARYYDDGAAAKTADEFDSPRDYAGHGTHTASTAAGNHGVPAKVDGEPQGRASGMAPAARLAAYKVCWETNQGGACSSADAIAAIDQAVADGVDVINYSVGGSTSSVVTPVELAFLGAADAGVFVATSAGNVGEPGTVAHNAPWVTTVAASTHRARGDAPAPAMTSFSSAGPAAAGEGDLLKPDLTAPGQAVIAAVAPPGNDGAKFAALSGTSMASPHVAGMAALVRARHPGWSPMRIKSALMTTASQDNSAGKPIVRGKGQATPFDYGAGHVDVSEALRPGLVYDSGRREWTAYACAVEQARLAPEQLGDCDTDTVSDPSDYNAPSIAISGLAHTQRVARTVTNVGTTTATYDAEIDAPTGTTVSVSPKRLRIPAGKSRTFEVTVTRTDADLDSYTHGALTWNDAAGHRVRSPLTVEPVTLSAPAEVAGAGSDGDRGLGVRAGYDGSLRASVSGGVPAQVDDLRLDARGPQFDPYDPATSERTKRIGMTVPRAGFGRIATFEDDYPPGTDIDVYLYAHRDGGLEPVTESAEEGSQEAVTATKPGRYVAFVSAYGTAADQQVTASAHRWSVGGDGDGGSEDGGSEDGGSEDGGSEDGGSEDGGSQDGDGGDFTVRPTRQQVDRGQAVPVRVGWSGLRPHRRYLGAVDFTDGERRLRRTVITVDTETSAATGR